MEDKKELFLELWLKHPYIAQHLLDNELIKILKKCVINKTYKLYRGLSFNFDEEINQFELSNVDLKKINKILNEDLDVYRKVQEIDMSIKYKFHKQPKK